MCNLYSLTRTRDELVDLFGIARDATGGSGFGHNGIYPDMLAPVVCLDDAGARELSAMRWGFPPPAKAGARPVTNVRNVASPFWRQWLKPEFRCLVPATSFCEWSDSRPKGQHWFEIADADPPVFAFAGIWRPWSGTRKGEAGDHRLFSFLTCEANDIVRPIHAKAMPVVLADEEEWDLWLTGATEEALVLQRPCPAQRLRIA
jgi:putative SOS response-associated peptidase YedK